MLLDQDLLFPSQSLWTGAVKPSSQSDFHLASLLSVLHSCLGSCKIVRTVSNGSVSLPSSLHGHTKCWHSCWGDKLVCGQDGFRGEEGFLHRALLSLPVIK